MCILWFKKKQPLYTLTHPQEPMNPNQTMSNVAVPVTLHVWLSDWLVPPTNWSFWNTQIVINVSPATAVADSWADGSGVRHLDVNPAWLNPGVIAHEQAHNSYSLLSADQKAAFSAAYTPLKTTGIIAYLYSVNNYGLTSDIEGHAEVYRYLADKMPDALKIYYPQLM